jgi:aminopeptidase-like protein
MSEIDSNTGRLMHSWATDLFPINRSLTGQGVRETLNYIKKLLPGLEKRNVVTGTKVYDWKVPQEWKVSEAFIEDEKGIRILDIQDSNLHLVGYSKPIDTWLTLDELQQHLYSIPHLPDAIPYITSYYKEKWGFCISQNARSALKAGKYRVLIKSELFDGVMDYADLLIKGKSENEIFFSTYICHPSMANNELSGLVLATALARYLQKKKELKFSYRFIFVPETIGAITYLYDHLDVMKAKSIAGFVLTCVGDERTWSLMPSRYGNTIADRAARTIFQNLKLTYKEYSFLERGSDERQYCAPGIDLPVVSVMRSKYREYPEYHTSLDNLTLITEKGLQGSYNYYCEIINYFENGFFPKVTQLCEPQLGSRGLYPSANIQGIAQHVRNLRNIIAYADGTLEAKELFNTVGVTQVEGEEILNILLQHGLIIDSSGALDD